MSVTPSFKLGLRIFRLLGVAVCVWACPKIILAQGAPSSAVSSQANIDVAAQRRLQETAREAQRQHRIEEQIRSLAATLSPTKLAGPEGPVLTRRALAALARLREEGVSPDDAFSRAIRSTKIAPAQAAKPMSYLRTLFAEASHTLTPAILKKLEAGEDPAPDLLLPPYHP